MKNTINPWEVKGDIDYEKIIKEFGLSLMKELPDIFNNEIIFRRKIISARNYSCMLSTTRTIN